jgi:hypothetical protein
MSFQRFLSLVLPVVKPIRWLDGSEAVVSKRPMAVTVRTRRERLALRGKSSNL